MDNPGIWIFMAALALVAFGLGWLVGVHPVDCADRVHKSGQVCVAAGGVLDGDGRSTRCVFTCTVPP